MKIQDGFSEREGVLSLLAFSCWLPPQLVPDIRCKSEGVKFCYSGVLHAVVARATHVAWLAHHCMHAAVWTHDSAELLAVGGVELPSTRLAAAQPPAARRLPPAARPVTLVICYLVYYIVT
ncbi:hypothetical protein O3P69_017328 [Scylla paramamosain]|uniref:Uncharacterized protein n=1 Tax=Scylla paramamosain TaxID=85552 RepID=A0AAW0TVH7_SCYPA